MIFVPSKGGRSHSAGEWRDWNDIGAGAKVLLNTLYKLANE
jgi:N-carbamoyl-L-amino-acid hydrolase